MKHLLNTILVIIIGSITLISCDDDLDKNSIYDTNEPLKTEFDRWLDRNFLDPFNIDIKYKFEDFESNDSYTLAPADIQSSIKMAKAIKYLWSEAFVEVYDSPDFLRTYTPRIFFLVGSGGYDNAGTVLAGTAEGGMKITLYRVNSVMSLKTAQDFAEYYFKTIYHEYFHILHQKKDISEEYKKLSAGLYVAGDWYLANNSNASLGLGFITPYSRNTEYEDFVEVASVYVVYGKEYWNDRIWQSTVEGREILSKKLSYVKNYFAENWGLDIDKLENIYQRRIKYIDEVLNDNTLN